MTGAHGSQDVGPVLAADVGRTTCRVARFDDGHRTRSLADAGGWSLADPAGVDGVSEVLLRATAGLLEEHETPAAIGVGTTGAAQDAAAGRALAERLQRRMPTTDVVIASDVVTAHVGGLAGAPGVLTIAGTGAVALAVTPAGTSHVVDGAGWLLGDAGAGSSIGRAGLAAAMRWLDGRLGGSEALAEAARSRFGPLARLPSTMHAEPRPARTLASFAPEVATAARAGDVVAAGIFADAVRELLETTRAAAAVMGDVEPLLVTFAGGLFDLDDLVAEPLAAAVTRELPRAMLHEPVGDAIDGAHRLVVDGPGLHDRLVHRSPATGRGTRPITDRSGVTAPGAPEPEES